MFGFLVTLIAQSTVALRATASEILWPALFFLELGLLAKRGSHFADIRPGTWDAMPTIIPTSRFSSGVA